MLIQPYLESTNVLLCPAQTVQARKPSTWDGVAWPDPAITDYAVNHQLGSEMGKWAEYKPNWEHGTKKPSTTVFITDAGTRADAHKRPSVSVNSPLKPGGFLLGDPLVGQCPSCVTGGHPNWCAPHIRHNGKSVNGFVDGHAEAMKPFWYYGNTPWLDPARGG